MGLEESSPLASRGTEGLVFTLDLALGHPTAGRQSGYWWNGKWTKGYSRWCWWGGEGGLKESSLSMYRVHFPSALWRARDLVEGGIWLKNKGWHQMWVYMAGVDPKVGLMERLKRGKPFEINKWICRCRCRWFWKWTGWWVQTKVTVRIRAKKYIYWACSLLSDSFMSCWCWFL